MNGPFTEADAVIFNNSIAAFEEATGIDIQYEGSKEFEASISIRVQANDPPDIADFPQPGLMATFARQGKVIPATYTWCLSLGCAQNYLQSWRDMATMDDGTEYGVWHRFNAKSLVWYPKAAFEASGYEIPTTWEELQALRIRSSPTATPPGASASSRARPPAGRPPTGPRSSCCAPPPWRTTTPGSWATCPSPRLRSRTPSRPSPGSGTTTPWSSAAPRPSSPPSSATPRRPCSRIRPTAGCTSRATSSHPSSRRASSTA
jgi:hypothetical protein